MSQLLKKAPRSIGVRQLMTFIAFFALVLALALQSWQSHRREARLAAKLNSTQYELHTLRSHLAAEAVHQEEMRQRFPAGVPEKSGTFAEPSATEASGTVRPERPSP